MHMLIDEPWSDFKAVVQINVHFFLAGLCAWIAPSFWPTRPEYWGMGIMSIALGVAAFVQVRLGLKHVVQLVTRRKALRAQTKEASAPKLARKVDADVLRAAGMKR